MISQPQRLEGAAVLPPLDSAPRLARRTVASTEAARTSPEAKRKAAGRFGMLNCFVDSSARMVSTTAQACWLVLFRETKQDGLATVSHQQIAECIGMDRKTATRALQRLEATGLLTVVRRGGLRRGPGTYRIHATPKSCKTAPGDAVRSSTTSEP